MRDSGPRPRRRYTRPWETAAANGSRMSPAAPWKLRDAAERRSLEDPRALRTCVVDVFAHVCQSLPRWQPWGGRGRGVDLVRRRRDGRSLVFRARLVCPGTGRPLVWSEQADGFSGAATVVMGPRAGKLSLELACSVRT